MFDMSIMLILLNYKKPIFQVHKIKIKTLFYRNSFFLFFIFREINIFSLAYKLFLFEINVTLK